MGTKYKRFDNKIRKFRKNNVEERYGYSICKIGFQ